MDTLIKRKDNWITLERKFENRTIINSYKIDKFLSIYGELPKEIGEQDGEVFFTDDINYKPISSNQVWHSYFDYNFGEVIDSPMKLREIEKTKKGAYYSADEFKKFNEQKLNNYQNKQKEATHQSIMSGIRDIKQGRSFVKELREQAEKYR
jgi:hypothetical protein